MSGRFSASSFASFNARMLGSLALARGIQTKGKNLQRKSG
jgi:hypothetical protein